MSNLAQLEKEVLSLTPSEREHLALVVWQSLESKMDFDFEGIELALERDQTLEGGSAQAISHSDFVAKINGSGNGC